MTVLDIGSRDFVVLDGALATELERRGADLNDPLWSAKTLLEEPELIRQVHYDYLCAGADVITTASYQASFAGFARRGLDRAQAAELMRLSVRLAGEARDAFWAEPNHRRHRMKPLIAASVGPYGAVLADGSEYRGDYGLTIDALMDWHRPRLAILASAGADLLACETIPCAVEGAALLRLLSEFPEVPAWLAYSCRDGAHLASGDPFTDAVALANGVEQIVAVGVNCTAPRYVESLLAVAGAVTDKPLLCYPNSGEWWDPVDRRWVEGTGAGDFGALAVRWRAAGARWIGGCCRTTPADIQAISSALRTQT